MTAILYLLAAFGALNALAWVACVTWHFWNNRFLPKRRGQIGRTVTHLRLARRDDDGPRN